MFRQATPRAVPRGFMLIRNSRRTFLSPRRSNATQPIERFDIRQLSEARQNYDKHRTYFLAAGAIAGVISFIYTANKLRKALAIEKRKKRKSEKSIQLDSAVPTETFTTEAGSKRKVVIRDRDGHEIVPTGNSTVPEFPRTLELALSGAPSSSPITASIQDTAGTEYTLVGLGLRTVSFLSIQVYVVGLYIATSDIAQLQNHLVKKINPIASTLIPSEREALRKALLDPVEGEETWNTLMQDFPCRSVFRIAPVRDTDFHHLRDGFVRAITARSQSSKAYGDETFGEAMREFKALFNRGKVPKKQEMLLCRDENGGLTVMYDDGKGAGRRTIGQVKDERISKLLWLNYLAGSKVASESARQNIIDGIMEFVERPVGTVATQVV